MTAPAPDTLPEVCTADAPHVADCAPGGLTHDYRPHTYRASWGRTVTSWRCIWCHAVACGDYGQHDPCMEPYHHRDDHVTRAGVRWPIGGTRP